MAKISTYLKNILIFVLILQFIPPLITSFYRRFTEAFEVKSKVGVVTIDTMILDAGKQLKEIKTFFEDPSIKALVLMIDSPGGAPGASQALFREILDLKKTYAKMVFSFSQNLCTSGAYYVAAAADYIITQPSTLVGSIGVYFGYPNFKGFLDQLKIKYNVIETGNYKMGGIYFKDLTSEQEAMLKSLGDSTYQQFINDIASRRPKLAGADPKTWADGKTYTGIQALDLGLIDELGSLSSLEQALQAKAPVEGRIVWVHPPQPGLFARLTGTDQTEQQQSPITTLSFFKHVSTAFWGLFNESPITT